MTKTNIEDLPEDQKINEDEMKDVKGGLQSIGDDAQVTGARRTGLRDIGLNKFGAGSEGTDDNFSLKR